MFFFTLLIGACVAIQSGALKTENKSAAVSLIQTAKTDPHALIQMLEGADKDTLKVILKLLGQLKNEAIAAENRLTQTLAISNVKLVNGKKELDRLKGIAIDKRLAFTRATEEFNIADGKYQERKREHVESEPRLSKEIGVFNKVLVILRNLLNNQPQDKELVELGTSAEGQTYQKMIEKFQANPEKLKQVITIVEKLLNQSQDELKSLLDAMNAAKVERDAKLKARNIAFGALVAADAAVKAQVIVVSRLQGALTEARKEWNTQVPLLRSEKATLDDVMQILNEMLKAQG